MAPRKEPFQDKHYYHVFNRGVDKRIIFKEKGDIYYFLDSILLSNKTGVLENRHNYARKEMKTLVSDEKLVSVISYCLLPNHFHFILRQETEEGISKFMHKLLSSYVKYFNNKYERSGSLFQGKFKANHLDKEGSLSLTSAYVNLNYKHHKIDPKTNLVKTSLFEYLNEEKGEKICNQEEIKEIIKSHGGIKDYKKFLKNQSQYFTDRKGHDPDIVNYKELENNR